MLRDGHSYKDIAQELGISLGNVHSLVFRYFPASRRGPLGGKFVRK
ncbi:sigma factor-like helix-turn-helix DNA-binding protein [Nitrospirillum iridis]